MVSYTQYHELSDSCVLTGDDLAYLFPDLATALVGTFRRGELVTGQAAPPPSLPGPGTTPPCRDSTVHHRERWGRPRPHPRVEGG